MMMIIVNEVAPRPHNSDIILLKAVTPLSLKTISCQGNTDSKVAGIMVNLVGAEGFSGDVIYENINRLERGYTAYLQ
jgi:5-(carboxyamino)imidazole ribonucleotide synthase